MVYNISIAINNKVFDFSYYSDIITNIANNLNCTIIYEDFELEGINNYVKNNYKIIVVEFDYLQNIIDFIKFVKEILMTNKILEIQYIYYENSILYCSNKYYNSLDRDFCDKDKIKINLEKNRLNSKYSKLYNILFS
jgi:hypothetical protein